MKYNIYKSWSPTFNLHTNPYTSHLTHCTCVSSLAKTLFNIFSLSRGKYEDKTNSGADQISKCLDEIWST